MISFIVDAYDPWERVSQLLQTIRQAQLNSSYEVILANSSLLEFPHDECLAQGRSLFDDRFHIVRDDSLKITTARRRAEQRASGTVFCYLSPHILPTSGCLEHLEKKLSENSEVLGVSPVIVAAPFNTKKMRLLCHGYGLMPDIPPIPLLRGVSIDHPACKVNIPIQLPPIEIFMTRQAFYANSDTSNNFESQIVHIKTAVSHFQHGSSFFSCGKAIAKLQLQELRYFFTAENSRKQWKAPDSLRNISYLSKIPGNLPRFTRYLELQWLADQPPLLHFQHSMSISEEFLAQYFWKLLIDPSLKDIADITKFRDLYPELLWIAFLKLREIASKKHMDLQKEAEYKNEFFKDRSVQFCKNLYTEWIHAYKEDKNGFIPEKEISLTKIIFCNNIISNIMTIIKIVTKGFFLR